MHGGRAKVVALLVTKTFSFQIALNGMKVFLSGCS